MGVSDHVRGSVPRNLRPMFIEEIGCCFSFPDKGRKAMASMLSSRILGTCCAQVEPVVLGDGFVAERWET